MPRSRTDTLPVIVVGGGIGGLAAAVGLARSGHRVLVLERADGFGEIGAGIQLAPNAFHALGVLGIAEQALRNAVFIERLVMMDAVTGNQVAEIPLDESFRRFFGNPYAVIHRADLHGPLLDFCRSCDHVELRAGSEVERFDQASGTVQVDLTDGTRIEGCALIGADGIRSVVRTRIVGDGELKVSGHVAYRTVLPIEEMPEDLRRNAAVLWAGPKCHFVHYPLRGGKLFNIVATFHEESDPGALRGEAGNREELLAHFTQLPPTPRSVLERSHGWRRWVLGDRDPVQNWTVGSVTLLGDAAHPAYQYFAQGACMALEDAVCMMREAKACGGDFGSAFQRYQAQRITRTARVVLSSRAIGQYLYHSSGVERLVRNDLLGSKSPEDFHRSLDWIYGYGRAGLRALARPGVHCHTGD